MIVGIDGGGTKTAALLADAQGRILGKGEAGSSNYQKVGFAQACAEILGALAGAYLDAGLEPAHPSVIGFGLSGVDRLEDQQRWEEWVRATLPDSRFVVVNDAELPLAAGTPQGVGVGVICGTGAICVGRNGAGQMHRADGWGYELGDDGSGYAIGREAMRAVLRALDGRGRATELTGAILAHWGLSRPEALLDRVYVEQATPAEIAALATVVNACASRADTVAVDILNHAGQEIARTIHAVVQRLGMEDEAVPCALAGGVITKSRFVADFMIQAARVRALRLEPLEMVTEPVVGAVRLAQRLSAGQEG